MKNSNKKSDFFIRFFIAVFLSKSVAKCNLKQQKTSDKHKKMEING
jgi:hypothetical protein